MMINVAKNIRAYSGQELRELAYKGVLECNGFDLTDFCERIFEGYEQQLEERLEESREEWENEQDDAEELQERIDKAIRVLEGD